MFETGGGGGGGGGGAGFELMSVNHSTRSGGIIGIHFRFSLTWRFIVCSQYNRLIEAILMKTHNIPFSSEKKKIT